MKAKPRSAVASTSGWPSTAAYWYSAIVTPAWRVPLYWALTASSSRS